MLEMLGVVIGNLFTKPATRKYPFVKRSNFKDIRGSIDIKIEDCIFCGICSTKCPSIAIEVNKAEKSWQIDKYKCIICGVCSEVCPKKCIRINEYYENPSAKVTKHKEIQLSKEAESDA